MATILCRSCGEPTPSKSYRGNPKAYCSQAFQKREWRRRTTGWESETRSCVCGHDFVTIRRNQTYCSRRCGWLHRASLKPKSPEWAQGRQPLRMAPCLGCREPLKTRASRPLCDSCRRSRRTDRERRKNVARRTSRIGRAYSLVEIGDRDDWVCHLCRTPVDRHARYPDPMSGSRDHILPLSLGGIDDPGNVRLAHWICNSRRGARLLEAA